MVERHHGEDPLARIRDSTPVLEFLAERGRNEQPLAGVTVGVASHLEPTTGVFVETLRDAGAEVLCTASAAPSVHADVVAHLDDEPSIATFAEAGMTEAALDRAQVDLLKQDPDVLVTDGAELLAKLNKHPGLSTDGVVGCAEQTTSGVTRLEAMADDGVLDVPAVAVNHTPMKHWFDNVHGTGESAVANVMLTTNTRIAGRTAVVAGYGYVGRGIATKLRDLGAETVVTEVDPRKAMRAHLDGHRVLPMADAAPLGDLFVTATGTCHVIDHRHFERMPDGALLCNLGHGDVEIAVDQLESVATEHERVGEGLTRYKLPDGRELDLFAAGNLANLAGPYSQGHPAEVMDSTFACLFVAVRHLPDEGDEFEPGVHRLPEALDREVAERMLDAHDLEIDSQTALQREYVDSWEREALLDDHGDG